MKKIISVIACMLVALATVQAQNRTIDNILHEVEKNSITLKSLSEKMEAQKLANHTGIFLANPEVEFGYLWGNPTSIGNRTDISVSQSFDFPTLYVHRSDLAKIEDKNVELAYKSERINLLLTAQRLCINLIYANSHVSKKKWRVDNAEKLLEAYQKRKMQGESNLLEVDKAELNLTTAEYELNLIIIERDSYLSELKRLNGGKEISYTEVSFKEISLPSQFELWYNEAEARSPVLQYINGIVESNEKKIKVSKAMGLPKFSAGYMRENIVGQTFQGATIGISVPLWQNKNRVKQARAELVAAKSVAVDSRIQFYNTLKKLHSQATAMHNSVAKLNSTLDKHYSSRLLLKALDSGEISLLDYLVEMQYYYNAVDNRLETERDMHLVIAELKSVEL